MNVNKVKYLKLIITIVLVVSSCTKQEIQLPLIEVSGVSEIQNHSSIWIFYEAKQSGSKERLNKNNKIINTHWIFNIDRRLPMKSIVPHLIDLQEDKNKDSMHKKEGMLNYFSYADTEKEQISLCLFNQTKFISVEEPEPKIQADNERIIKAIYISEDYVYLDGKAIDLEHIFSSEYKDGLNQEDLKIRILFDAGTTYQDYLRVKAYLAANHISTEPVEYMIL